ncbi:MAG: citrate synthase [Clostridia bacterium]|nr:citrate synthase [Clostridia bacterium]
MARKKNCPKSISELTELCRESYMIPEKAFTTSNVKRGLRNSDGSGVVAGVTNLGLVHGYVLYEGEKRPDEGKLLYRGYDVEKLVEGYIKENRYGFEECAFLLLFGVLPTAKQLEYFKSLVADYATLPLNFTEDVILRAPSRDIMNKIQSGILALYSYDENPEDNSLENQFRQSIQLIARIPTIAAHAYSVKRHVFDQDSLLLHRPMPGLSCAQNFMRILGKDVTFSEKEARLLDLCMVLHAEHGGGNNSTFAARVLSSTGTDIYSSISAAVGSLKGPKHGGANIKVDEMFTDIKNNLKDWNDDDEIKAYLEKILKKEAGDGSGLIYGMGHAIYTKSDPRAVLLKKYAKDLAKENGFDNEFNLLEKIEKLSPAVFTKVTGVDKTLCANVDMYSGLVYRMMRIPTELFTPLFATARVAGWCAHRIEENLTGGRIIRPAYKTNYAVKKYVPISKR